MWNANWELFKAKVCYMRIKSYRKRQSGANDIKYVWNFAPNIWTPERPNVTIEFEHWHMFAASQVRNKYDSLGCVWQLLLERRAYMPALNDSNLFRFARLKLFSAAGIRIINLSWKYMLRAIGECESFSFSIHLFPAYKRVTECGGTHDQKPTTIR